MTTHSSTLAWEIPWTKEPGVAKGRTWLKRLSTQTSSARLMNSSSKSWPVDRGSHRSSVQRKTHVRYRYESISEAWFHPWSWLLWDISVSLKQWNGGFCNLNELKLLQILPDIYFYFSWKSLAWFCCGGPGLSSMISAWRAAVYVSESVPRSALEESVK